MTHIHVNNLQDFIDFDDTMPNKEHLMESPNAKVKLVALKKHQELPKHNAEGKALLYLLEGELKFTLIPGSECLSCGCGDDACEEHELKIRKGEFIRFDETQEHQVYAEKDSKFLVICLHK